MVQAPRSTLTALLWLLCLCVPALAWSAEAAPGAASSQDAARGEFMAALQRVRLHVPEPPDSTALQSYVLYDYLVAARLRRDLDLAPGDNNDAGVDAFLQAHARQPVTRALRHDWLTSLAERHRWDWFLPRAADISDPVLLCQRLEGRLETGDTQGLGVAALTRWNIPQQQPHECDAVFAWLRAQGLVTPALAEVRTRAALAAGNSTLAREFSRDLPAVAAAPLLQWAQLLDTPRPVLNALVQNVSLPVEPDALDAGFNRLARSDSSAALALLPRLSARPDMTPGLLGRLQRDAALGAAYERNPAAVAALAAVPRDTVDDEVWQWRVRAALWAGDYVRARSWVEEMPASLAALPRWRYWHARSLAATHEPETASALYSDLAGLRDYYGYLAADRLHRAYSLNSQPSLDDQVVQAQLAAEPGLLRAHALFDCDLADDAGAEWANVLGDAQAAVKVQAAHLADAWGWYAQSIATLAQAGDWNDVRLRYPRPYAAQIADASALTQIPADWILAVMRQESLFRTDAVSRAGARGLMQIRPATATALARRWRLPRPGPDTLFDPAQAVLLGAAYLRELLDRYSGQLGPGLAAYNAGTVPVARWLPGQPIDADIWVENIAYGETRDYLQRIFEHIVAYAWVRDVEPTRLATLMPPVGPTPAVAPSIANARGLP